MYRMWWNGAGTVARRRMPYSTYRSVPSTGSHVLGARLSVSLDFRNVETVTASTLSKLLNLHRSIRSLGGRLRLRNVRPFPEEVFRATRLDTVFEVQDSKIPKRKRQLSR